MVTALWLASNFRNVSACCADAKKNYDVARMRTSEVLDDEYSYPLSHKDFQKFFSPSLRLISDTKTYYSASDPHGAQHSALPWRIFAKVASFLCLGIWVRRLPRIAWVISSVEDPPHLQGFRVGFSLQCVTAHMRSSGGALKMLHCLVI